MERTSPQGSAPGRKREALSSLFNFRRLTDVLANRRPERCASDEEEIPETSDEENAAPPRAQPAASVSRSEECHGVGGIGVQRNPAARIARALSPVRAKRPREGDEGDETSAPFLAMPSGSSRPRRAHQSMGKKKKHRECRALADSRGKTTAGCVMSLHDAVLVTHEEGDPRQSDPSGFGVLARQDLVKGTRFYDPAVKWVDGQPPEFLAEFSYIYVRGGGYLCLAVPNGQDGAFKSTTYFLNEARPENELPGSRSANCT